MLQRMTFKQFLPISMEEAWSFFSHPMNLSKITPSEMNFIITSPQVEETYAGQLITYKVSPVAGIQMNWVTEITQVKKPHFFIDNQVRGPYKLWHHQHHFKEVPGGVEMTDILHYEVPLGFIGNWINALFVRKKVQGIFDYRKKALDKMFPKTAATVA